MLCTIFIINVPENTLNSLMATRIPFWNIDPSRRPQQGARKPPSQRTYHYNEGEQISNDARDHQQEAGKPDRHVIQEQIRTHYPPILSLSEALEHTPALALHYCQTE